MKKILMSACLIGEKVRYDGKDCLQNHPRLKEWMMADRVVYICPEMAGGLPTPRLPAEIEPHGSAEKVLHFQSKVFANNNDDVSDQFRKGAEKTLLLAKQHDIKVAILKARSPSCGSKQIYDGTYSKKLVDGMGVTAYLLAQNGVRIFDESEIDAALCCAESL